MGKHHDLIRIATAGSDYDPTCPFMGYTGNSQVGLKAGFKLALENEVDFLGLTEKEGVETVVNQVNHYVDRFVTEIFRLWASVKSSNKAKDIASFMKEENKQIISFVETAIAHLLSEEKDVTINDCLYLPCNARGEVNCEVSSLCQSCPNYIGKTFYICPVEITTNEVYAQDFFRVRISAYRYLWLATIKLFHLVSYHRHDEDMSDKHPAVYNTLLMLPSSIGKIYEMTNPVGEEIVDIITNKINQLQTPPVEHTEEEWEFFNYIWSIVEEDIKSGDADDSAHRYCRTWIRALRRLPSTIPKFDDKDYFFSSKASSYKISGLKTRGRTKSGKRKLRKQSSYLVGLAEIDPMLDLEETQALDAMIKYQSHYNKHPYERVTGHWSIMLLITNQGKRKPRFIRIFCNSAQDRNQYLEDLDTLWSDNLATSCRKAQENGYTLAKLATKTWLEYHDGTRSNFECCPSIYNTDFSDATDTVSQYCLKKFSTMLYGEVVANYWEAVCKRPFFMRIPTGESTWDEVLVSPKVGNPQGGKRSFTDFHVYHEFLILMMMMILHHLKLANPDIFADTIDYLQTPVETVARILGDDMELWSIKADPIINKDIFPFFDEGMGHGGAMYQVYCWLCRMSNWYLNPDKATITTPESAHAVSEFAKVTVVDGYTVTAPPFRMIGYMASRKVSHPIVKPLAFALWKAKTGHLYADRYIDCILRKHCESDEMYDFMYKMLRGGFIQSLSSIEDKDLIIDDKEKSLIRYATIRSQLEKGLLSQLIVDGELTNIDNYSLEELLWDRFDENLYNSLEDSQHKFNLLLDDHIALIDLICQLEGVSSADDKIIATFCNLIARRPEYDKIVDQALETILTAQEGLELIRDGLVSEDYFVERIMSLTDNHLRSLDRFASALLTKGTDKRPSVESSIGIGAWEIYSQLKESLSGFASAS